VSIDTHSIGEDVESLPSSFEPFLSVFCSLQRQNEPHVIFYDSTFSSAYSTLREFRLLKSNFVIACEATGRQLSTNKQTASNLYRRKWIIPSREIP
jgi:hypothetical protein